MTTSTLWWTQNELPPDLWTSVKGRIAFALAMLRAASDVAAAWWNAARDTRAAMKRTDPVLLTSLEDQRRYLWEDSKQMQLLLGFALSPGTTYAYAPVLSKHAVSSNWYYGDKDRPDIVRYRTQPYNPFWIVNTEAGFPLYSPVLVDSLDGRIYMLGVGYATPSPMSYVLVTTSNVSPMAFVDASGNSAPAGKYSDVLSDPSNSQLVMTTEDAVHAVVVKLLDFAAYIRTKMIIERDAWEKVSHPSDYAQLPPLPAPPPTILAAEQTSAPPAPEPGTLPPNPVPTTALLPVAVKDDNPPTPSTGTTSGPSGWQVAGAIGLAGVVGYGAWKITGAMMPPRARGMIANPSVSIPTPYASEVTEVGKKVFRDGSVEYWYRVKNGMTMGYQSTVKASKSSPQHASNVRAKFRYQLRNAANVREAEQLVSKLDEQLPS